MRQSKGCKDISQYTVGSKNSLGNHFDWHPKYSRAEHGRLSTDGGHAGKVLQDEGDGSLRIQLHLQLLTLVLLQLLDRKLHNVEINIHDITKMKKLSHSLSCKIGLTISKTSSVVPSPVNQITPSTALDGINSVIAANGMDTRLRHPQAHSQFYTKSTQYHMKRVIMIDSDVVKE